MTAQKDSPYPPYELNEASQLDLKSWERENIPYTMRKKRQEFFEKESQKAGKQIAG